MSTRRVNSYTRSFGPKRAAGLRLVKLLVLAAITALVAACTGLPTVQEADPTDQAAFLRPAAWLPAGDAVVDFERSGQLRDESPLLGQEEFFEVWEVEIEDEGSFLDAKPPIELLGEIGLGLRCGIERWERANVSAAMPPSASDADPARRAARPR